VRHFIKTGAKRPNFIKLVSISKSLKFRLAAPVLIR